MIRFFSRVRFLPLTIFAASLMLTVKIGDIWQGLDGMMVGAISVAGAEAQQPGVLAPSASPQAKAASAATGPARALTPTAARAAAPTPTGTPAGTVAPTKPSIMTVTDPTLMTQSEIDLLQQLAARRDALDARAREITMREALLKAAESRIDRKIQEMKTLEASVKKLIATYDDQQKAKVASLVKIYENMKPQDAARIFEGLDMNTLLLVAERMKERKLAPIMANMDPRKARDVTVELAKSRQLPPTAAAGG